jgi:transposase
VISTYQWRQLKALKAKGTSIKDIARQLKISRNTVKKYLRKPNPPCFKTSQHEKTLKMLDRYQDQIEEMLEQQYMGTRIHEELTEMGFGGSLSTVYRQIREIKKEAVLREQVARRFETLPGRQIKVMSNDKDDPIQHEHTKKDMAADLIKRIPLASGDIVLDAGSGLSKVWYNALDKTKYGCFECELLDGCDFLEWCIPVDWVIGNPPFKLGWKFIEKGMDIARKGIAFLFNFHGINALNPNRVQLMKKKGWYFSQIHIVTDRRWYGKYFFIIFTKQRKTHVSYNTSTY